MLQDIMVNKIKGFPEQALEELLLFIKFLEFRTNGNTEKNLDMAICGVVQPERLHGAESERQIEIITNMCDGFEYIAIKHNYEVRTNDTRFSLMQDKIKTLKLFRL